MSHKKQPTEPTLGERETQLRQVCADHGLDFEHTTIGDILRAVEKDQTTTALIAAAPDLLTACQAALARSCDRLNTRPQGWTFKDQQVHAALIAAIDKVEGRE